MTLMMLLFCCLPTWHWTCVYPSTLHGTWHKEGVINAAAVVQKAGTSESVKDTCVWEHTASSVCLSSLQAWISTPGCKILDGHNTHLCTHSPHSVPGSEEDPCWATVQILPRMSTLRQRWWCIYRCISTFPRNWEILLPVAKTDCERCCVCVYV